jgi:hypothetical protein
MCFDNRIIGLSNLIGSSTVVDRGPWTANNGLFVADFSTALLEVSKPWWEPADPGVSEDRNKKTMLRKFYAHIPLIMVLSPSEKRAGP